MNRIWLIARVLVAWVIGLAVAAAVFGGWHSLSAGVDQARTLAIASLPLIAMAAVVCAVFPYAIGRHPFVWASAAVAAALALPFPVYGFFVIVGLWVSLPAAAAFMLSVSLSPLPKSGNEQARDA